MADSTITKLKKRLRGTWSDQAPLSQVAVWQTLANYWGQDTLDDAMHRHRLGYASALLDDLEQQIAQRDDDLKTLSLQEHVQAILKSGNERYDLPVDMDSSSPMTWDDVSNIMDDLAGADHFRDQVVRMWDAGQRYQAVSKIMKKYDYFFTDVLEEHQYSLMGTVVDDVEDYGHDDFVDDIIRDGSPIWETGSGLAPIERDDFVILLDKTIASQRTIENDDGEDD